MATTKSNLEGASLREIRALAEHASNLSQAKRLGLPLDPHRNGITDLGYTEQAAEEALEFMNREAK